MAPHPLPRSPSQCSRLGGIENADSVAIDFHKLFWQPISCSAFLVRDVQSRTSSRLSAFAGVAVGALYGAQHDWGPEALLGYKGVVSNDLGVTTARFVSGGDAFTLRANDVSGSGAAAHLSLKGENGSGAFAIEGGAETRDGLSIYDLRLAGHIQF